MPKFVSVALDGDGNDNERCFVVVVVVVGGGVVDVVDDDGH